MFLSTLMTFWCLVVLRRNICNCYILEVLLDPLSNAGMKLKLSKCFILLPLVKYLGHVISTEGIHPSAEKIQALLKKASTSKCYTAKIFPSLLNYYGLFLPNL